MKFGIHASIAGGIDQAVLRAAKLECGTLQIFSTNPRGWKSREISDDEVSKLQHNLVENNIAPLVIHTPYLLNLASPKEELYNKSITALKQGVKRADKLGAKYLVLHPGSHTGSGIEAGIKRIGAGLKQVISETKPEVMILLENVAGRGTSIGASFEELAKIISLVDDSKKLGICFDTCHGFAAGYDLRNKNEVDKILSQVDSIFGIDKLGVIHANDSKGAFDSNKDRHEHIGQGKIGLSGFRNLLNHPLLTDKTVILETPVNDEGNDKHNLATLRSLVN
ncbi:apurinic endonuclease APN1 [Halobacteroides halobius DSM 5150]|uniref:Probable endonuclease 4 n=1 Tax=Halobacteroides halobius (strain ATCC 35273 / DSM 5150 / MD-1) TaxID=748449 RepID=L0K5X7_HALHC|nr:deoxyribonuclease IV [Halobacteroides halobius]AGB40682.1 apurinic endonuclease APN1 [Halobacteroides halobius DSM 5150]